MKVSRTEITILEPTPEVGNIREMEVESQDLELTGFKFGVL